MTYTMGPEREKEKGAGGNINSLLPYCGYLCYGWLCQPCCQGLGVGGTSHINFPSRCFYYKEGQKALSFPDYKPSKNEFTEYFTGNYSHELWLIFKAMILLKHC